MKTVTATFATSEAAQDAVDALNAAVIRDSAIGVEELESGETIVSAKVDDELLDAAAAILRTGALINIADSADSASPGIEGHPDGSGPVVIPIPLNR